MRKITIIVLLIVSNMKLRKNDYDVTNVAINLYKRMFVVAKF